MVELSSTGKLKDMTFSFQTFSNNLRVAFGSWIRGGNAEEKEKQREKKPRNYLRISLTFFTFHK